MGQEEVEAHSNGEGGLDRWGRLKERRNTGVTDVQNAAKQDWEAGQGG